MTKYEERIIAAIESAITNCSSTVNVIDKAEQVFERNCDKCNKSITCDNCGISRYFAKLVLTL